MRPSFSFIVHKPSYQKGRKIQGWKINPSLYFNEINVLTNIGNPRFWIKNLKRSRPQDAVSSDHDQNGKLNCARTRYAALISTFSLPEVLLEVITGF